MLSGRVCFFPILNRTRNSPSTWVRRGSGAAWFMFPLYFHYEDVSRQDPLLKPNHANVMEVPRSCEIRVVPKAPYDLIIINGKLTMEIPCGQKFIQTQRTLIVLNIYTHRLPCRYFSLITYKYRSNWILLKCNNQTVYDPKM